MAEPELPNLMEVGTRYQHYTELAELFRVGVDILETMDSKLLNDTDRKKKVKLEHAIELIEARLNLLSDRDRKEIALSRQVRMIPPNTQLLTEGSGANSTESN